MILRKSFCFTLDPPEMVTTGGSNMVSVDFANSRLNFKSSGVLKCQYNFCLKSQLKLHMKTDRTDLVYLIVHDKNQDIPLPMDFLDSVGQRLHVPIKGKAVHQMIIAVAIEIVTKLDIRGPPCYDKSESKTKSGIFECLEGYFQQNLGNCLMPWNVGLGNSTLPACNSDQLKLYQEFMNNLLEVPTDENFYSSTGCAPSCDTHVSVMSCSSLKTCVKFSLLHDEVFTLRFFNIFHFPVHSKVYSYNVAADETYASDHGAISLWITLKSNGVTLKNEALVFDALDMIGNIGGYLGLFLGWSLLSLFGMVQKKFNEPTVKFC